MACSQDASWRSPRKSGYEWHHFLEWGRVFCCSFHDRLQLGTHGTPPDDAAGFSPPGGHERCEACGLLAAHRDLARPLPDRGPEPSDARAVQAGRPLRLRRCSGLSSSGERNRKEVVARALHGNSSRRGRPFLAVNVAALPGELLESELFGHVRGAFTGASTAKKGLFEAADGGMLFLDEVAEMPLALQAKLLRVLQDGEIRRVGDTRPFAVNVRVVCATHRELGEQVRLGLFRQDLYDRLKVLTVRVPPLRERPEDVLSLAEQFLRDEGHPDAHLTPEAAQVLLATAGRGTSASWPVP